MKFRCESSSPVSTLNRAKRNADEHERKNRERQRTLRMLLTHQEDAGNDHRNAR